MPSQHLGHHVVPPPHLGGGTMRHLAGAACHHSGQYCDPALRPLDVRHCNQWSDSWRRSLLHDLQGAGSCTRGFYRAHVYHCEYHLCCNVHCWVL